MRTIQELKDRRAGARRVLVVAVVLALVLLGTGVSAQQETMTGGGYRLTSLAWQVSGAASGGGYRVWSAEAPDQTGHGCCCAYLPGITKLR